MTSPDDPSPVPDRTRELTRAMASLKPRWGWIAAWGAAVAGMGIAALILVASATIASVYTIAIFMILAGGGEIATGLSARTWGRFVVRIAAGLAYIVAASFALAQPLVAAAIFTLAAWHCDDRHGRNPAHVRSASSGAFAQPRFIRGPPNLRCWTADCCRLASG